VVVIERRRKWRCWIWWLWGVLEVEMEEILEVRVMELKRDGCGGGLKKKEEEMVGGFVEDGDFDGGGRRWKEGR